MDEELVIPSFPGSNSGVVFPLLFHAEGQLPDVVPECNVKGVVRMQLSSGMQVGVLPCRSYMDVEVKMALQSATEGFLGLDVADEKVKLEGLKAEFVPLTEPLMVVL